MIGAVVLGMAGVAVLMALAALVLSVLNVGEL
jgi:hypothetical protein